MSASWFGIEQRIHRLGRHTVILNKALFDSTLAFLTLIQDHQDRLFFRALDLAPWVPEEARRILVHWSDASRRWREDYRASVYHSFELVEQYLHRVDPAGALYGPRPEPEP